MTQDATLARLLMGWLDGDLPENEQSDLLRRLEQEPPLRRAFAEQVIMLGATRAAAEGDPRWLALFDLMERPLDDGTEPISFEQATMRRIEANTRPARSGGLALWGLAASVALFLAATFMMKPKSPAPEVASPSAVADTMPQPAAIATVVGASAGVGLVTGTCLPPGALAQEQGWLTVRTFKGVSITLDAPFQATLAGQDRIRLEHGRVRVHVPPGATGFRLESPGFNVVDLGTEFAVRVNPDGTGTCRVFEGKADVLLLDSMGETKSSQRLKASQSVGIKPSEAALQAIEERDADYPKIKLSPRPVLSLPPSYPARVMAMRPASYWRFERAGKDGVPDEVPGGSALHMVGSANITPEAEGNHSGALTDLRQPDFFKVSNSGARPLLRGDFTISMLVQFSWLQNFVLVSSMRYDHAVKGHSFILQSYASLGRIGIEGSALHAVLRDPPAWGGGVEFFGHAPLRPLRWHHIAATRSGSTAKIFLDGAEVARSNVGTMRLHNPEIYIGRLNGNLSQPRSEAREMVGHIDELAIFPRALTHDEIRNLDPSAVTEL